MCCSAGLPAKERRGERTNFTFFSNSLRSISLPGVERQNDSEVAQRCRITIGWNCTVRQLAITRREMRHDVVTEEIDIETTFGFASNFATEDVNVECFCAMQVVDRN